MRYTIPGKAKDNEQNLRITGDWVFEIIEEQNSTEINKE